jgi:hypothetical protein
MTRPWAVILTAAALVGCRSTQPAANPFLQTTVPPPATGAPMIVPGEQFSPGVVPAPAVAPVPVITPAVPVAPPPPVAAPIKDKFDPPGGSFQYNQSSLERSQGGANPIKLASYQQPVQAPIASQASAAPVAVAAAQAAAPIRPTSTIRILPPQARAEAPAETVATMEPEAESTSPVLRLTVGDEPTPAEGDEEATESEEPEGRMLASKDDESDSADDEEEEEPKAKAPEPVDAAVAERAGYAYAPDYVWLRGRLEYSQSSRQWKLRYIPIDGKTDQFGGSVKLPASNELAAFQAGDMVAVRGSLARDASASGSFAPRYEVAHIEPVVR